MHRRAGRLVFSAAVFWFLAALSVQGASVRGRFVAIDHKGLATPEGERETRAVVWLAPLSGQAISPDNRKTNSRRLTLTQKNKRFDPHVSVVEVGGVVDFPNRDPFFHNVFSLFDGKRFDLGLYEAGSTRSVRFDRPGVCYIFCNIHSEMSSVVVVVDTPYFAVTNGSGEFEIPEVPAGRYRLNVWAESCLPKTLKDLSRELSVGENGAVLETIHLLKSPDPITIHRNKYGKSYDPPVFSNPTYRRP